MDMHTRLKWLFKRIRTSVFVKNSVFLYAMQIGVMLLGYLNIYLLNNYGGIILYGQLAILSSVSGLAISLFQARINDSVIYFLSRSQNRKFILAAGIFFDFIIAFSVFASINLFADVIIRYIIKEDVNRNLLFYYSLVPFIRILRSTPGALLSYFQKFRIVGMFNFIDHCIRISGIFCFAFFYGKIQLTEVIFIYISSEILCTLLGGGIAYRYYCGLETEPFKFSRATGREIVLYNSYNFFATTVKSFWQNIDNLILAFFLNAESVGTYDVIKKISSPIFFIVSPLRIICFPKIVNFYAEKKLKELQMYILKITAVAGGLAVFVSAGIYVLRKLIFVWLKVEKYNNLHNFLLCMLFYNILMVILWWSRSFAGAINPKYSMHANILCALYSVSISIFLVWKFQIMGVLGASIGLAVMLQFYWWPKLIKLQRN